MKRTLLSRIVVLVCVTAAVCILTGCSKKLTATVSGKVTYQGAPIKTGTITFHGAEKKMASAAIQPDGTYTCTEVPMGDVKVTVEQFGAGLPGGSKVGGPGVPGKPGGGGLITPGKKSPEKTKTPENAPPAPELAKLPANVGKLETTPLKYTIDSSNQTIDIVIP